MLGVLAVIGVLSVGGIAGYNLGIEKQRANELLEASLQRAYTVSAQLLTGRKASLVEFEQNKDKAGGTFQTGVETGYAGKFGIQIQDVNQNVCKTLVRSITDTTPLRGVSFIGEQTNITEDDCQETNNLILFYNNDMSLRENSGNGNENNDSACADVVCEDGLTCSNGECKCSNGLFVCGEQCCAEGTYCAQGADTSTYTCAVPTGECTKNSDCKDAEGNVDTTKYCKFTNTNDCSGPTGGTCTDKGTLTPKTLNLPGGTLTVYKGAPMNWWSAVNFCEAHDKKQLVTMSDLGVSDPAGKNYCYFDSSKTTDTTLYCECSGDEGCTTTTTEIYDKLGTSGNLWLADNSKSNSCDARRVYLNSGDVIDTSRISAGSYALCR